MLELSHMVAYMGDVQRLGEKVAIICFKKYTKAIS